MEVAEQTYPEDELVIEDAEGVVLAFESDVVADSG